MDHLKPYFIYPGPLSGFSLHNHSTWSDGGASAEAMCRAAKAAGIRVFGLSDHYVVHPDSSLMPVSWSIDPARIKDYCAELERLKQELNGENFTLYTGFEVDFFFENVEEVLSELEKYPLDYLIGSVHYSGTFPIDSSEADWKPLSPDQIDEICRIYWEKMLGAAQCGRFTFLGHLDLPKKFGFLTDGEKYLPQAKQVLDAAAASGVGIELNTAGWFKPCSEPYPSLPMLREANLRKIPAVINPDAHCPEHVTRGFSEAAELLRQAGYPLDAGK